MAKQAQNEKISGLVLVIIGTGLFILSAGPFLINLILILAAIWILNYGLYLQNQPPIWTILGRWLSNFRIKLD